MKKGKIKRPIYGSGNAYATLTATLTKGGKMRTVTFPASVRELDIDNVTALTHDTAWLTILNSNRILSDIQLPSICPNKSTIKWESNDSSVIEIKGFTASVVRPDNGTGNSIVTLKAVLSNGNQTSSKFFDCKVIAYSDLEVVQEDAKSITWELIKGNNIDKNNITENLLLPSKGAKGSKVTWISTDKYTVNESGVVNRPKNGKGSTSISLAATLCKGNESITVPITQLTITEKPSDSIISPQPSKEIPAYSYLRRFVALPGEQGYVDSSTINTNYWINPPIYTNWFNFSDEFWDGRNSILGSYSSNPDYKNSTINATSFEKFIYQLMKDRRNDNIVLTGIDKDFTNFVSTCNKEPKDGGYGLSSLNRAKKMSIFLTYHFKTVTNIFDNFETVCTDEHINILLKHAPLDRVTVLDWIDCNNVKRGGIIAFTQSLNSQGKSFMNIEPRACTDYICNDIESLMPSWSKYPTENDWKVKESPKEFWVNDYCDPRKNSFKTVGLAGVFIHELGHAIDNTKNDGIKNPDFSYYSAMPEWRDIAGWCRYRETATTERPAENYKPKKWPEECTPSDYEPPVSSYGCSSPDEDFAETFSYYILNEKALKRYFPKRYEFMEKYIGK